MMPFVGPLINNIDMLSHCDAGNNVWGQKHCCTYSQGVEHYVNSVRITSTVETTDCLFVYPVQGDAVSGFYRVLDNNSNLIAFPNVPTGMLQVVSGFKTYVFSCINSVCYSDAFTAKLDFDKETKARAQYGRSYTVYLENIIDSLTNDDLNVNYMLDNESCFSDLNKSVNCNLYTPVNTDRRIDTFPNTLTAHLCTPSPQAPSKIFADAQAPYKNVGFLNHSIEDFQFIGPDRSPVNIKDIDQCLNIAAVIASTGVPNYAQARFPLTSGLNIQEWENELGDYHDKMLLQYLKFGFPLSLSNPSSLNNSVTKNHHSALQYPTAVNGYLQKELSLGAIIGPANHVDSDLYHCSPLLSRPKDDCKRRIILNLSHPHGNSVNGNIPRDRFDGKQFTLRFPSVDTIVENIGDLRDCDPVLFKIDVARAFRNIRVDPVDAVKLGIHWEGQYFLDLSAAFGWAHGSAAFQRVSDAIVYIMRRHGYDLVAYIDDYIGVAPASSAESQFQFLSDLLTRLGLPMNPDKRVPPSKALTCLGIRIDINASSLSIDHAKLQSIYKECLQVSAYKYLSKKRYQSLLGKLIYLHKCVAPARIFVNRILELFRNNFHKKKIRLTKDFFNDIAWFLAFLPHFNGTTRFNKPQVRGGTPLYLDASLTGIGAIWADRVYSAPVPCIPGFALKIVHLEMWNIVIAFRVWGHLWKHSSIAVNCDNEACVHVIATSRTKDPFLAVCIRNLWLITAFYDISLQVHHIRGKNNIQADVLSRLHSNKPINSIIFQDLRDNYVWHKILPHHFHLDMSI